MAELPSGTVTFLFTDLEGSTRLWEEHPAAMQSTLARHDAILREAVESHAGHVVKHTGDGGFAVFATARDALGAAVAGQAGLAEERWGSTGPLRVRMGLHTGEAQYREGDYFGTALNRAARLMAVAHGGQIVCSRATADLARDGLPTDVGLVDLGEHRLRDLSRAEQVFQVVHRELIRQFPPLRTMDAFPGNLPVQLTSFIGRYDELVEVAKALESTRLVTVTGVGGVGKTRLASQVAAELLPRYPDGAWLCELAAAGDPEAMAQVVAATLGVIPRAGMSVEESIADYLTTKKLLLVLDNCEHLLSAAGGLAERLLRQCVAVRVLATSREGLAVAGEQVWPLRSLPVDGADGSTSDAARLFVDRARAVRPAFAAEANAVVTAEICQRLDGIPLAIELAAARVAAMSAADIAAHLDERFRLLTGGRRSAVERHQTLRATVDWSYSLLDEREQRVLERLGVFAGSFDTAAAEAVVAGDGVEAWDVLDALTALVEKSMVQLEESLDGGVRYLLLETLRQYARERLDERGDPDVWRRRHAEHYLRFAETAGPALYGPDALVWGGRPRLEADNMRAAVFWALGRVGDDTRLGLGIIAWLAFVTATDPAVGVGEWAETAHELADRADPPIRTAVLAAAAWRAYVQGGDLELTRARALAALRDGLAPRTPSPQMAYTMLIWVTQLSGDPGRALEFVAEGHAALDAIATGENADDIAFGHVDLHIAASSAHAALGDERGCRAEAEEALRQARERRNPIAIGVALEIDAMWSWHDHPDETLRGLDEATTLLRHFGNISPLLMSLALRGHIEVLAGHTGQGLDTLREAMHGAVDAGDRLSVITTLDRILPLAHRLGHAHATVVLGSVITGTPLDPLSNVSAHDREERAHSLERARAEMTPDDYAAARAHGAAMTYDEIVQYTLDLLDRLLAESAGG